MTVPDLALRRVGGRAGGPVLVLGPSLGTPCELLWAGVVTALADDVDCYCWDLPGHGLAPVPTSPFTVADLAGALATALRSLGRGPVHAAGDSLGGAVTAQLALDHPELVASLTVCCSAARIGDEATWQERVATVRGTGTAGLVSASAQRWFAPSFAERHPEIAGPLLDALAAVDDDGYIAACGALARYDIRDRLAGIRAPLLAVAGAADLVVPTADVALLADGVADGRLVELDDVAHLAPSEAPERVARLLLGQVLRAEATSDPSYDAGIAVRRQVLGAEHVDRAAAVAAGFGEDFQDFITRFAWGSVWTRPGLDRQQRSLITITALVALGQLDELALHVAAARRNGLTDEQIAETLLHCAVYVGVPKANSAFRVAQRVLDELPDPPDGGRRQ